MRAAGLLEEKDNYQFYYLLAPSLVSSQLLSEFLQEFCPREKSRYGFTANPYLNEYLITALLIYVCLFPFYFKISSEVFPDSPLFQEEKEPPHLSRTY